MPNIMSKPKPKKSLWKRIKKYFLLVILIALVIESVALYRLYKVHVAPPVLTTSEEGEMVETNVSAGEQIRRLRDMFKDTSAQAWAAAQKSGDPEDTWYNIGYRPRADVRELDKNYTHDQNC